MFKYLSIFIFLILCFNVHASNKDKIIKNIDIDHKDINEIFFYPSGRVDIKTKNNLIIKFPLENVKEAIIIVNKIINNKNYNNNIIDLRVPNQLILSNE